MGTLTNLVEAVVGDNFERDLSTFGSGDFGCDGYGLAGYRRGEVCDIDEIPSEPSLASR